MGYEEAQIRRMEQKLRDQTNRQLDRLERFGTEGKVRNILAAIESNAHRFKKRPLGPIGKAKMSNREGFRYVC